MILESQDATVWKGYGGLSTAQAEARLKEYGPNARPTAKQKNWLRRLAGIFLEPMMLLLVATGVVYLFLGDAVDTVVIFISIIPIGIIEFFQETRTSAAILVLDTLLAEVCKVYRDEKLITLESKYIVPGDLVFVAAGDKLPADGILINSAGLQIDESILTGESAPVIKTSGTNEIAADVNRVFQGTLVVQGEGKVVIAATGGETAYGKLGSLLEKIKSQKTSLQRKIEQLVRGVALGAVSVALLVGIMLSVRDGLLLGLLGALTIAISIIPEEFPVVFSVFLIMGVWRLAKEKALVREMVMVETLGSATVICSDKTGTLTQGKMSLQKVYYDGRLHQVTSFNKGNQHFAAVQSFIRDALLAVEQIPVDPIETELQRFGKSIGVDPDVLYKAGVLRNDGYFDAATKMVHHTWETSRETCFQYTAGAPELIIKSSTLEAVEQASVLALYEKLAHEGYRVIGIAKTPCAVTHTFVTNNLEFKGLIAMSDPLRPGVAEAVATCQAAGIRVLMITGDNIFTARSIAAATGIEVKGVIEGAALERATTQELRQMARENTIFARVKPEQKYLIVEALQANGEVVAMTGDGVNDAPALKKADIGIAMGQKGTEVARAAAGIVLLDDNFATIVNAVREGRRIYDNMRRAFSYLLTFHIPIIGLSLIPIALGKGLFFLPIHIIFLELFCDPAVVLGFERDKLRRGAMQEPPRPRNEPLIHKGLWKRIVIQGGAMLLLTLGIYFYVSVYQNQQELGRTMAFCALVISELLLIILTHEPQQIKNNRFLLGIICFTVATLVVIVTVPFLRSLFHFSSLTFAQLGIVFFGSVLAMVGAKIVSRG